jgi:hypothetical protein
MCAEICVLCGHVLFHGVGRRYKKHEVMKELITRKCVATPYVYSCITKHASGDGKHTVCIACVNWTRRLSLRNNLEKVLIPMDNLILFVMKPGQYVEPDKRTLVRLLHSLCRGSVSDGVAPMLNHYNCFEDGTMRSVKKILRDKYFVGDSDKDDGVDYSKDAIVDLIIREWWIYNGMSDCLEDKATGRYVRRMIRTHRIQ